MPRLKYRVPPATAVVVGSRPRLTCSVLVPPKTASDVSVVVGNFLPKVEVEKGFM